MRTRGYIPISDTVKLRFKSIFDYIDSGAQVSTNELYNFKNEVFYTLKLCFDDYFDKKEDK